MKPVHLYGPIAWFGVDSGVYHVEQRDAFCFVSDTHLPVPLLVEHNPSLVIGQVVQLHVEQTKLVAHCVVDDSLFLSLLKDLQAWGQRYQDLEPGDFLNILLPSFSSYHTTGSFIIHEISLVDIGRRGGALWKVKRHADECQQATARRITIPIEKVKNILLYLLLCQRQQDNRTGRLCKDASVCGHNTTFVSASSLNHSKKAGRFEIMAKMSNTELAGALVEFSKRLLTNDSGSSQPTATEPALGDTIYSYNDLKQMLLKLEKKQSDRDELEEQMGELVKRRVAKELSHKTQTDSRADRHRTNNVKANMSDADDSEEEQTDHSYTAMPVGKRVRKMITGSGQKNGKKHKTTTVESSNDSGPDIAHVVDDTPKGRATSETSDEFGQMKDQLTQIYSMLTSLTSTKGLSQQAVSQITGQCDHGEGSSHQPAHESPQTTTVTPTHGGSGGSNAECHTGQKNRTDVKSSALNEQRSLVGELFKDDI